MKIAGILGIKGIPAIFLRKFLHFFENPRKILCIFGESIDVVFETIIIRVRYIFEWCKKLVLYIDEEGNPHGKNYYRQHL